MEKDVHWHLVFSVLLFVNIVEVTGKLSPLNGSCNQIYYRGQALGVVTPDGVYNITVNGSTFPVYCDMTTDGGGWTLLVYGTTINRATNLWTESNIKRRNENNPGGSAEYSILYRADSIKDQGSGITFQYRIDGWSGGLNNGGIWEAAKVYSFISTSPSQTNVNLVKKYGEWTSAEDIGLAHSISNRMPWLGTTPKLLTTFSGTSSGPWWGTLIQRTYDGFGVGAWVLANSFLTELRYWMREMTSGMALKQVLEKKTDKFSIRTDQYIPNHIVWFAEKISRIECGIECSSHPRCLSYNFQKSTDIPYMGRCELNAVLTGNFSTRPAPRTGSTLYEMVFD